MLSHKGLDVTYLEHDTFRIKYGELIVYTDPFQIMPQQQKADIVTITHEHFDHLSDTDLKKVLKEGSIIVASINCREKLQSLTSFEKVFVKPGEVVEKKGITFYHAGDTDNIEEMKGFKDVSLALLPASGTYVMTAEEAASAAVVLRPDVAIPMHWGAIEGTRQDAERFKNLATDKGIKATVMEKSPA